MYSLPSRDDDLRNYDNIPLRDFSHPQQSQQEQSQQHQNQSIEHEGTKKKCKKYKWSIYGLVCLLASALIAIVVLGALYSHSKATSQIPKNGTVYTSFFTTTTSIPGKALASTQTLPPVTHTLPPETQTLPPITQTTLVTKTEVSHVTTEFTKTSVSTATDTKKITVTPTKDPHDGKRCNNNQHYGGSELHDINSDYDLLLVDAIQEAVDKGMDIGDAQVLDVALRSIFTCSGSHSILLVEACESGFDHQGDNYFCNSFGSYPIPTPTQTDTETQTATISSRRNRIARGRE